MIFDKLTPFVIEKHSICLKVEADLAIGSAISTADIVYDLKCCPIEGSWHGQRFSGVPDDGKS
jgi:hypothetical protein